jgi:hypothetical protein
VTLEVTGPRGEPLTGVWIELVDPSGHIVLREATQEPEHKICDFGFGPHTLRVGANECLPVAISNVRVVFGHPVTLKVILNGCGYREEMRSACLVYFRTVGEDHMPIPGVSLSPRLNTPGATETDGFGRWQGLVLRGGQDVSFTKPGFAPAATHLQCGRDEELDVEVVMKRAVSNQP